MTELPNTNALPHEVQAVAAEGWKLFPVKARAKDPPLIAEWPVRASCDLAQLNTWAATWPGCNWAVVTGSESGIFALDIDRRHAGDRWFEQQVEAHGIEWTDTRQAATKDGTHFYFCWPSSAVIPSTNGDIASGVDTKGWHGYAMVPPSIHPDGPAYTWRTPINTKIQPAPDWLLELLREKKPRAPRAGNGSAKIPIPEGMRNSSLASLAGSMRRRGFTQEAIKAGLIVENVQSCVPPLPETEVETIAESISRYQPEPPEPQLVRRRPITDRSEPVESALFETAREFAVTAPSETHWLLPPWLAAGSLNELIAKIKCGKTTLLLAMIHALVTGGEFLGQRCERTPVVYLVEAGESALRESLARAQLLAADDLHLMRWHKVLGNGWTHLAAAAIEKATKTGAKLIAVDTASQFMQLAGDSENNAGVAMEALAPLQTAQQLGITTLLVRHEKKADTSIEDSARGSSAAGGACDSLLRLRRLGGTHPVNFRKLEALSRFSATPSESVLEWTANGYQLHSAQAVTLEAAEKKLLECLPRTEQDAMTCKQLAEATGQTRRTIERALAELVNSGVVNRIGAGVKNLAFRYYSAEQGGTEL